MKLNRGLLFGLPIVAIILLVFSCSAKDITSLDNNRISQPVCGDLPQNDPRVLSGDCVTSREALGIDDEDGRMIEHPVPFVIALAAFGWWGWLLYRALKSAPTPAKKPGAYLLAPLFMQDTVSLPVAPETCDGMIACHPTATAAFVVLLALLVAGFLYGRKRARDRKDARP